jgi:hypothetical protein
MQRLFFGMLDRLTADPEDGGTPVDSGHASSNWVGSVGAPFQGVDGSREDVSYAAQDAGRAELKHYRIESGQPVSLTNNVEYLARLNDGWSAQQEAGFVERAVEASFLAEKVIRDLERSAKGIIGRLGRS